MRAPPINARPYGSCSSYVIRWRSCARAATRLKTRGFDSCRRPWNLTPGCTSENGGGDTQHDLRSCSRPNPARPIHVPRVPLGPLATTLHQPPRRKNQRGVLLYQPNEQQCGPVGRPATGLPRLNEFRADVQVTGEHGLGHLEAGAQPSNAAPVYRRRWRWQLGGSQLSLALGMLEGLIG